MGNWYSTGDDAEKRVAAELARQKHAREEAAKDRVYRFWLPAEAKTLITFVDEFKHPEGYPLPFVFMEHQLQLNGNWKNWFTCIGEGCPLCANDNRPSLVAAYTIIDHTEWKSKKTGEVHKDELKLFMAKPAIKKLLLNSVQKRGALRGWRVEVLRNTAESQNTGDSFDFEERTEIGDDIQPYDYLKLFEPKPIEELEALFGGEAAVDADDGAVKF